LASDLPDIIAIEGTSLNVTRAVAEVSHSDAGAVVTFLGTTRAETRGDARRLLALDYEAYREMAEAQMRSLAEEARRKWSIVRVAMIHRVGRVEIGQPSVLIAVCTPHRAEAFEACRFLIEGLKKSAAIWKKEIWEDGASSWVGHRDDVGK
jgi:molybdopterin synthase catalytic subunit